MMGATGASRSGVALPVDCALAWSTCLAEMVIFWPAWLYGPAMKVMLFEVPSALTTPAVPLALMILPLVMVHVVARPAAVGTEATPVSPACTLVGAETT